jgi:hypothetical protein
VSACERSAVKKAMKNVFFDMYRNSIRLNPEFWLQNLW